VEGTFFDDDGKDPAVHGDSVLLKIRVRKIASTEGHKETMLHVQVKSRRPDLSSDRRCRRHRVKLLNFVGHGHMWPEEDKTSHERGHYDAAQNALVFELGQVCGEQKFGIELRTNWQCSGMLGAGRKARAAKLLLDQANVPYGVASRGLLTNVANAAARVRYAFEGKELGANFCASLVADLKGGKTQVAALTEVAQLRKSRALAIIDEAGAMLAAAFPETDPDSPGKEEYL